MYNVSQAYKTALSKPIRRRNLLGIINDTHIFGEENVLEGSLHITNRCSDSGEVKIGSVYIGEMTVTLRGSGIPRIGKRAEIVLSEGLYLEDESTEQVPLGTFYVASCTKTASGYDIVAHDRMYRLNKRFPYKTIRGSAFDFLKLISEDCQVDLGMTRGYINDLTNGDKTFKMYAENDVETYRDFLHYIAQYTCTFATMTRENQLVLREYGQDEVDTITPGKRYEGCRFEDFVTEYSAVTLSDIKHQEEVVYGNPANGDTMVLGANPFLQGNGDTVQEAIERIIIKIQSLSFTPFEVEMTAMPYDLGDMVKYTGGLVGSTAIYGCVMMYDYTFHNGYKIVGFGSDPDMAHAKSSTDKAIAGLKSASSSESTQFYQYTNTRTVAVSNEKKRIIDLYFVNLVETFVIFQAEILLDAQANTDLTITYQYDNIEMEQYVPKQKVSGHHILSLFYPLVVGEADEHHWAAFMVCDSGGVEIPAQCIKAVIWGQGLLQTDVWDGRINAEDEFTPITFSTAPVPVAFAEELSYSTTSPHEIECANSVGAIPFSTAPVPVEFEETLYVNKGRLKDLTWGEVKQYTWGEILELFNW